MTIKIIKQEIKRLLTEHSKKETVINRFIIIATDNGANMVKGIKLLNKDYFNNIIRQPCAAHTLQLSVQEGLKQCKQIHRRIKSLQAFF